MNLINSKIKDYTLIRELHRGANTVVYYAKNQLGAEAAVKVMVGSSDMDVQNLRKHFLRQAQLLVALKHDYITHVYDFYEDTECVAIIMEYLNGQNLQAYMALNPVTTFSKATEWYGQVLQGFEKAHKMGIIHRDVNPSSLFLTNSEKLKILNFGTAKIIQDALAENLAGGMKTIIQPEIPYYKSPEQIMRPNSIDHRSDIYSLGLLFYIMTTGIEPYSKKEIQNDIIYKSLPKPIIYSQTLYDVVLKATAKQVKDRFESCTEFLLALQNAVLGYEKTNETTNSKESVEFLTGKTQIINPNDAFKANDKSGMQGPTEIITEPVFNVGSKSYQENKRQDTSDLRPESSPPPYTASTTQVPPPFTTSDRVNDNNFELNIGNEIYSAAQMKTAAIMGGPAVFAYFLSENCKVFKEYDKASKYMMNGVLAVIPYYAVSALTDSAPLISVLITILSWVYMFRLTTNQQPQAIEFIRRGGRYRPLGNVLLAYVVNIAIILWLAWKFS
ncbi:hypothetical protein GCM10028806_34990 [Spirosoma terrae]|uniref:Serine/threonine protein kinase n=1 Tax=Spirosoma terrae TaxID=1968276 RepID=A0A6L9LAR6_9BACT|nr:serine/threonine-protein kinase [Spirosoma terrae]NDU97550.1 serine/threonine protein kinase [Spirosoma terrae]